MARLAEPTTLMPLPSPTGQVRRWALFSVVAGLLATLSLLVPFLIWRNAWFEWSNYYWLVLQQQNAVKAGFLPTYFIRTPSSGYLYPIFVFNGAPVFWMTAIIGVCVRSAWAAFILVLVTASTASYLGTWWIARNLGLSRLLAIAPAILIGMSTYVADDLYGRGDWAELVVVGFAPLLVAELISLFKRPDRPTVRLASLLVTTAVMFGADNAATLCFGIASLVVGVCMLPLLRYMRIPWSTLLFVLSAMFVGMLLDSWYLVPSAWYAHDTLLYLYVPNEIAQGYSIVVDHLAYVLNPLRTFQTHTSLHPQLPSLVLLWSLIAGIYWWRRTETRRLGIALCIGVGGLIVLLTNDVLWVHFPTAIRAVQFPWRMVPFDGLAIALLMIVGLRAVGPRRIWKATALIACGTVIGLSSYQAWSAPALGWNGNPETVSADYAPYAFQAAQQEGFHFQTAHLMPEPSQVVNVAPRSNGTYVAQVESGVTVADVASSPFVKVSNAKIIGEDGNGFVIVQSLKSTTVSFRSSLPLPALVGIVLSLIALAMVPVVLVFGYRSHNSSIFSTN
jgi:hypothetical protein